MQLSIIPEETQVILIGCSEFPKDENLCSLPGVINNVNDLGDLLADQQIIGIPKSNITILLNPTSASTVASRLVEQAKQATDTLIVYYAGHGLIGRSSVARKLLLAVGETTSEDSAFNTLEFEKVRAAIHESLAKKKLLILDCCYSGRALSTIMSDKASLLSKEIDIRGAYTITSAPSNAEADAPEGAKYTAFSGKLIEALRDGINNQKSVICLEDLYQQIRIQLLTAGHPEPQQFQIQDADQIAIARNRKFIPPITSDVVFIGDSDDVTVHAYRLAAKQCIDDSQWLIYDRSEVCFASDPTLERCYEAASRCGVYVALLGNFYGQCYEGEDISHTEHELKVAEEHSQSILVFLLPEESDVSPSMSYYKAQAPLLDRQDQLLKYVQSKPDVYQVLPINSPEELATQLKEQLAAIQMAKAAEDQDQPVTRPQTEALAQRVDFLGEYSHLSYDRRPVLAHTFKHLDSELLDSFLAQPQAKDALDQSGLLRASTQEHLQLLGLLINSQPVFGAFLCFAPRRLLVDKFGACSLAMAVFDQPQRGAAKSSPRRVSDNLLNLSELGMRFLRLESGLKRTGQIGTESRDDLEIPELALKEALVNALVHRDYEQQPDQPTRIDVYPDRVEIISYGEALVDLNQNPEEIVSTKRNHAVAEIFRIMQLMEENASGISRMHQEMRRAKLPPPILKEIEKPSAVKVIFRRPRLTEADEASTPDFTISKSFAGPSALKPGAPFQAPPLPSYFVDRPEFRNAIKDYVLSRVGQAEPDLWQTASQSNTLVVSAIYGLGGIGKSILAAAIAHDREIHAQFPDGILWITLGQQPDILPLLSSWIQALGDYDYQPINKEAASAHLQTQLYDKRALLIVDDVWNPEDADFFRVGGANCCVLVTTREAQIEGATRYSLNSMTPEQSLKLMVQAVGQELNEAETESAKALAQKVGYLPLALELITAQISLGVSWAEMLVELEQEVIRLESLDRVGTETIDESKRRKHSLIASFNLSLKRLSAAQRNQFAWLGIVPEDVTITETMAATLWQVSPRKAAGILRTLRAKALLLSGGQQSSHRIGYRMHDLMHDLAQKLLEGEPNPIEPGQLPGLGLSKEMAHATLLTAYKAKTQKGLWHTLPDDGYIHAHLTWHLQQANQLDEIHSLLQEETADGRNGWYVACDELGQVSSFSTDIARAWELANSLFETVPAKAIGLQYRYALIKTSLNSLAQTIPSELVVALIKAKQWQPAQGLAYVQQLQNPFEQSRALANLFPHLPKSLLPKALEVTRTIQDENNRAWALSELAKQLPELLPEALEVTRTIQDEDNRAIALRELAKQLPPELLPEALEVTRTIQSENNRAIALRELAKQTEYDLIEDVMIMIQALRSDYYRASALHQDVLNRLSHTDFWLWQFVLQSFASRTRRQFFYNLRDLIPFIKGLGRGSALQEVADAMRDVARQWP